MLKLGMARSGVIIAVIINFESDEFQSSKIVVDENSG